MSAPTGRQAPAEVPNGALPNVGPILDADEAAALLKLPKSWLLAEARADRIPHLRFGRYVRFERDLLEAWWQERRHGPWRARGAASRAARTGTGPVPLPTDPSLSSGAAGETGQALPARYRGGRRAA